MNSVNVVAIGQSDQQTKKINEKIKELRKNLKKNVITELFIDNVSNDYLLKLLAEIINHISACKEKNEVSKIWYLIISVDYLNLEVSGILSNILRETTATDLILRAKKASFEGLSLCLRQFAENKTVRNIQLQFSSYVSERDRTEQEFALAFRHFFGNKELLSHCGILMELGFFSPQSVYNCKHLYESFGLNTTISFLNLSNNVLKDEGIIQFSQVLNVVNSVSAIGLASNMITDVGMCAFFKALRKNKTLTRISLMLNEITAESIKCLADEVMPYNRTLHRLHFSGNKIGSEGIKHFARGLLNDSRIVKVSFEMNGVDDSCIPELAEGMSKNNFFKVINLKNNPIEKEGSLFFFKIFKALISRPFFQNQLIYCVKPKRRI